MISNVEGFILNDTNRYLKLYNSYNGTCSDSILLPSKFQRVLIIIDKVNSNWIKVKHIRYAPGVKEDSLTKHNGLWIKNEFLYFNVGIIEESKTTIYKKPNKKEMIDIMEGSQTVKIIEVKKGWAKISYKQKGIEKQGWVDRYDQCSYFWTACNWN